VNVGHKRWTHDSIIEKLTSAPVLGFANPKLPYLTKKFCEYLYGANFTVVTDSNPLNYILTTAKLDATCYRWLSALSTFSFKLQFRAGKQNIDADALSRRPHSELMLCFPKRTRKDQ
jgi:hypothetical protein